VTHVKKLFAIVVMALVASSALSGAALARYVSPADASGSDGLYTPFASEYDEDLSFPEAPQLPPGVFSGDAGDWVAVIVRQDYVQSVLVRLYGRITGPAPSDAYADVIGIDFARTWIGDSDGNPYVDGDSGRGYVIIEGTASSEAAVKDARLNWIGYSADGRTFIQDFSACPVPVGEMRGGEPAAKSSGGCDSALGGVSSLLAIACIFAAPHISRGMKGKK
jgi:hypothetical protein